MNIFLNGKKKNIKKKILKAVLKKLEINTIGQVVSVNDKAVPWKNYGQVSLKNNDRVEIKKFWGGG
ncbi:sulfur carrier protein ThiS [bacterium]|nr:sulfur carrier protein ThiS [Candidatus Omnitrophota bacterium]MBU2527941.1 sulfur carrier protein ThiS [bacterium]MBU3929295.1 sulfur carrier protein ThiS [bacterium]MBU4122284.1 sulfur carrier protein ThiS [bacterium]